MSRLFDGVTLLRPLRGTEKEATDHVMQLAAKSMALSCLAYRTPLTAQWLQDIKFVRNYKTWCGQWCDHGGKSIGAEAVTGITSDVSEELSGPMPFVAFRGTKTANDMIADAKSIIISEFRSELINGGLIGQAGKGYIDHLSSLKDAGLGDEVVRLASQCNGRLLVCGHSLGGAMATLLGSALHRFDPQLRLYVVTFGAPRVFLESTARVIDTYTYTNLRFINEGDLVPTLGNEGLSKPLFHVGSPFYIRRKANDVVQIDNDMALDWANDPSDIIETAELIKDFLAAKAGFHSIQIDQAAGYQRFYQTKTYQSSMSRPKHSNSN